MDNLKGKTVYISGPITDTEDAPERFAEATKVCRDLGAVEVFNPMDPDVQAWREGFDHDMHILSDLHILTQTAMRNGKMCAAFDAIVMLDGYGASKGAFAEQRCAEACGIEVLYMWNLLHPKQEEK